MLKNKSLDVSFLLLGYPARPTVSDRVNCSALLENRDRLSLLLAPRRHQFNKSWPRANRALLLAFSCEAEGVKAWTWALVIRAANCPNSQVAAVAEGAEGADDERTLPRDLPMACVCQERNTGPAAYNIRS